MDIRELHYIVEIANAQNITKAASNLYISQPALSKSLKKVEAELGLPLFFRDGYAMIPTEAGNLLLHRGKQITQEFDVLQTEIQEIKSMKRGTVVIGIPPAIVAMDFPNVVHRFRQHFPGISLKIKEFGARQLEEMVLSGTVDVAISMRPINSESLSEIPLIRDQIVCAMSMEHPFSSKKSITIKELSTVPFNTFPEEFAVHQYLLSHFREAGVFPTIEITSPTCEFLIKMSRLSGEICVLPAPCIICHDYSNLVLIPFNPSMCWELCIVYKRNAFLSDAAKAMIASLQHGINPTPL